MPWGAEQPDGLIIVLCCCVLLFKVQAGFVISQSGVQTLSPVPLNSVPFKSLIALIKQPELRHSSLPPCLLLPYFRPAGEKMATNTLQAG
jgi:hypothetical protein